MQANYILVIIPKQNKLPVLNVCIVAKFLHRRENSILDDHFIHTKYHASDIRFIKERKDILGL